MVLSLRKKEGVQKGVGSHESCGTCPGALPGQQGREKSAGLQKGFKEVTHAEARTSSADGYDWSPAPQRPTALPSKPQLPPVTDAELLIMKYHSLPPLAASVLPVAARAEGAPTGAHRPNSLVSIRASLTAPAPSASRCPPPDPRSHSSQPRLPASFAHFLSQQ